MEYPIYYGETVCGRLRIEKQGLMTVFSADCEYKPGLMRLYICGDSYAPLGVMQPQNGRLVLKRSLSKNELSRLPELRRALIAQAPPQAAPADAAKSEDGWQRMSDGTLKSSEYIALPCALRRKADGIRLAEIDGKEYLLFRY